MLSSLIHFGWFSCVEYGVKQYYRLLRRLAFHIVLVCGLKSVLWVYFFSICPVLLLVLPTFMPLPSCLDFWSFIVLGGSQLGTVSMYWEHVAILETILIVPVGVRGGGGLLTSSVSNPEMVTKHSTCRSQTPIAKNYSVWNVGSAKVEKPCFCEFSGQLEEVFWYCYFKKIPLTSLSSLYYHMNFRICLSVSTKAFPMILIGIAWKCKFVQLC